jgi:hypothetical protein
VVPLTACRALGALPALAEPVAPMTSVHAKTVKPRRCISLGSAGLGSWGAEADPYVCEIFISFSFFFLLGRHRL